MPLHACQTARLLKNRAPKLGKPFCLFISLVNPHDVYVYPTSWQKAGYRHGAFANLGIELPANFADDLLKKIQRAARAGYDKLAPLNSAEAPREYVNFYTYLNTLADKHVTTVLDTLEETGLLGKTIILRLADHGEGGLSHGMREKAYTAYEEMIHIPLIVHNPQVYPPAGARRGVSGKPHPRDTRGRLDLRGLFWAGRQRAGI